jgi:SLT domain-containing protein
MINNGEIDKKGGLKIGGYNIIDSTLEAKARGGPVEQGKPYVVGEEGPEIIIPRSDGNVLSNDDSQIYAMLLASNPQLQKVSRQRAEKILRNRFPEYFEG